MGGRCGASRELYGAQKERISGSVVIISERRFCANCQPIIDQLQNDFPNIQFIRKDLSR